MALGDDSKAQLELELLIKEFLTNIKKARSEFERNLEKMEDKTKETSEETKDFGKSAGVTGKGLGKMAAGIGAVVTALGGMALLRDVTRMIREQGLEAVKAGIRWENMVAAMKGATGDVGRAAHLLEFTAQTAEEMGLSFEQSAIGMQRLEAASKGTALTGEQVEQIFSNTSSAMTTLGLTVAKQEAIWRAFEQMLSKNKVQAEELRQQLGDHVPGAVQKMAFAIGVTQEELDKMLEEGRIAADEVLPAFSEELKRAFSVGTQDAIESVRSQLERTRNELFFMRTEFSEGFFDELADGMDIFNATLRASRPLLEGVGERVGLVSRSALDYADAVKSGNEATQKFLTALKETARGEGGLEDFAAASDKADEAGVRLAESVLRAGLSFGVFDDDMVGSKETAEDLLKTLGAMRTEIDIAADGLVQDMAPAAIRMAEAMKIARKETIDVSEAMFRFSVVQRIAEQEMINTNEAYRLLVEVTQEAEEQNIDSRDATLLAADALREARLSEIDLEKAISKTNDELLERKDRIRDAVFTRENVEAAKEIAKEIEAAAKASRDMEDELFGNFDALKTKTKDFIDSFRGVSDINEQQLKSIKEVGQELLDQWLKVTGKIPPALQAWADKLGIVTSAQADARKEMERLQEKFAGNKEQIDLQVKALDRWISSLGGAARVNEQQTEKIRESTQKLLDSYLEMGSKAPAELLRIADAFGVVSSSTQTARDEMDDFIESLFGDPEEVQARTDRLLKLIDVMAKSGAKIKTEAQLDAFRDELDEVLDGWALMGEKAPRSLQRIADQLDLVREKTRGLRDELGGDEGIASMEKRVESLREERDALREVTDQGLATVEQNNRLQELNSELGRAEQELSAARRTTAKETEEAIDVLSTEGAVIETVAEEAERAGPSLVELAEATKQAKEESQGATDFGRQLGKALTDLGSDAQGSSIQIKETADGLKTVTNTAGTFSDQIQESAIGVGDLDEVMGGLEARQTDYTEATAESQIELSQMLKRLREGKPLKKEDAEATGEQAEAQKELADKVKDTVEAAESLEERGARALEAFRGQLSDTLKVCEELKACLESI